jgi:putative acetyltransferase
VLGFIPRNLVAPLRACHHALSVLQHRSNVFSLNLTSQSQYQNRQWLTPCKAVQFGGIAALRWRGCVLIVIDRRGLANVIRNYRDGDLGDLLETWAAASEIAHPFLTTEFLDSERENIPNLYLPNADTWVFEVGGKVVGFVALIGNEIGAIFVHPSQQRNGVGSQLMEKAKELHSELEVEVFAANTIGRGFYAKHEFETLEEKVHDQTGNDLLRLRLA